MNKIITLLFSILSFKRKITTPEEFRKIGIDSTITLVAILIVFIGIYGIVATIFNLHKNLFNFRSQRLKHQIIHAVLGTNAARIMYGIFSVGFIIIGSVAIFKIQIKPKLGHEYNYKTDKIFLVKSTVMRNGYQMSSTVTTTLKKLDNTIKILGKKELNTYITASFKNNYLEKIPDIIWEMKNLKKIDFSYNNITDIPIEKLVKMDNLQLINLMNNPISKEKIKVLQSKTKIQLIVTDPNEVYKP